jgi:ornithine cyclodeaminase
MLPTFDEEAIRRAVGPAGAVAAIRDAFRADGDGRTVVPAVINLAIPGRHGEVHVKSAYIEGVAHIAVKVASGFYENPRRGLPSGSGLMILLDAATGFPVALLFDNGFLTDIRTGAAGAVAAEHLARARLSTVGVLGTGVQARHQIACLREVRRFDRVLAWGRDPDRLARYCRDVRDAHRLEAEPCQTPERVVREADLVVTTTPSREPLVRADWLRAGQHITAVGADSPGKQELDPACLARADLVVVDRLAQCAAFGELQHVPNRSRDAVCELGEIVAGRRPGRTNEKQITIADLTGVGFQDTAIASLAFERCAAQARRGA